MKTSIQRIQEYQNIVTETEYMFKLQEKWWQTNNGDDLDKLKSQSKKVKELIRLSKI
jgi:hypothetical protein